MNRNQRAGTGGQRLEELTPSALALGLEKVRIGHGLPALAAGVVRSGSAPLSAAVGFRHLGNEDPVRPDDKFHIASCTKSMTATLAALLVHEGRLRWESRLVDAVPELGGQIRPEYGSATLELLLAHAAQMPAYTQFGPARLEELKSCAGPHERQRLSFLAEVLGREPPNPGSGPAAYSNVGYVAAAAMLECAIGEPWEELVLSRLARRLGLTTVGFGWPATVLTPDQPRGHAVRAGRLVEQPLDDPYLLPVVLWPAGAVHCSIEDLARHASDHLSGLCARGGLLPRASYDRLHRTLSGEPEGFTLGWGVRQDPRRGAVHHSSGSGGTFFTRMVIIPQLDIAVVAASNSGEAGAATGQVIEVLLEQALTSCRRR
jgi:CubicO group peptidase (beta-lactamase class C family)